MPSYFVSSFILFLLMFGIAQKGILAPKADIPSDIPFDSTIRIICYGGSSTAGFPFPPDWPHTYPNLLQDRLRKSLGPETRVINLGEDRKSIRDIRERLPADLKSIKPDLVVINTVVNSIKVDYRKDYPAVLQFASGSVPTIYLVLEPFFNKTFENGLPGPMPKDIETLLQLLRGLANGREVIAIGPTPTFQTHRDEFLFMDSTVHLTKFGNRLLADLLAETIASQRRPIKQKR